MQKPNPPSTLQNNSTSWLIARIALFSALSGIGALIKTPSPIPTVAFDSTPGFFAALYFGAVDGAIVCGLGHLISSAITGFPLGYYHIPIAVGMALAGAAMGLINKVHPKWGFIPAVAAGILINTLSVFFVAPDPAIGLAGALAYMPFIALAAILNSIVAALVYLGVRGKLQT
ncbi:MAG: ECF transporter S component [Candidatus Bathyarchaeota archaeon]|nr:ECF transporter S component [Candidatus Bathyarchaeota archaeon]